MAVAGMLLGLINVGASIFAAMTFGGLEEADDPGAAGAPVIAPPPTSAPLPVLPSPPRGTATPPPRATAEEGGQMTAVGEVTEVKIGGITLVDVPPSARSLPDVLEAQAARARAAREKLVIFTDAAGCRPCMSVAAVMPAAPMQRALERVRFVRVDVHEHGTELEDLGVQVKKFPGFYLLGPELTVIDGLTGAEWDDDTAENVAPVLGAFVRGKLAKRREAFTPEPGVRRPKGGGRGAPRWL